MLVERSKASIHIFTYCDIVSICQNLPLFQVRMHACKHDACRHTEKNHNTQRQTRMRPCAKAFWDFLCSAAKTCLRHDNRRDLLTFVPDQMAGSSTSPVSKPRQKCATLQGSHQTLCWLMTQQLPPTPRRNSSH